MKIFLIITLFQTFFNNLGRGKIVVIDSDYLIRKSDHLGVGILCSQCLRSIWIILQQVNNYFSKNDWSDGYLSFITTLSRSKITSPTYKTWSQRPCLEYVGADHVPTTTPTETHRIVKCEKCRISTNIFQSVLLISSFLGRTSLFPSSPGFYSRDFI